MSDITATSLARQSGLLKELTVIANNVANAGTAGFKRESSVFTEYVVGRGDRPSLSMASLRGHYAVLDEGAYTATGAPYDVAIGGEGFFAVEKEGEVFLTRGGQFQLDAERRMVNADGFAVLDEGGGAIEIPEEAVDVTIATDGTISADGTAIAALGVFTPAGSEMDRMGGNLWRPTEGYSFVDNPDIRQGYVEQSNVNPVMEMARLIEAQRLFEMGQSVLDDQGRRTRTMIETLGKG